MNVELYDNPRCIVFNDIFDDKTNKAILDEAIKNKRFFTLGEIGSGKAVLAPATIFLDLAGALGPCLGMNSLELVTEASRIWPGWD